MPTRSTRLVDVFCDGRFLMTYSVTLPSNERTPIPNQPYEEVAITRAKIARLVPVPLETHLKAKVKDRAAATRGVARP